MVLLALAASTVDNTRVTIKGKDSVEEQTFQQSHANDAHNNRRDKVADTQKQKRIEGLQNKRMFNDVDAQGMQAGLPNHIQCADHPWLSEEWTKCAGHKAKRVTGDSQAKEQKYGIQEIDQAARTEKWMEYAGPNCSVYICPSGFKANSTNALATGPNLGLCCDVERRWYDSGHKFYTQDEWDKAFPSSKEQWQTLQAEFVVIEDHRVLRQQKVEVLAPEAMVGVWSYKPYTEASGWSTSTNGGFEINEVNGVLSYKEIQPDGSVYSHGDITPESDGVTFKGDLRNKLNSPVGEVILRQGPEQGTMISDMIDRVRGTHTIYESTIATNGLEGATDNECYTKCLSQFEESWDKSRWTDTCTRLSQGMLVANSECHEGGVQDRFPSSRSLDSLIRCCKKA